MSREYYDECLKRWNHPTGFDSNANFIGYKPTGYVIYSRNRDSSILEETNFAAILKDLGGEGDLIRVIRHRHWACGWIEYITVDDTSPEALLDQCVEIAKALAAYPILNEDAYEMKREEAMIDHWNDLTLDERIDECRHHEVSIFAARRLNDIPQAILDYWRDQETFF